MAKTTIRTSIKYILSNINNKCIILLYLISLLFELSRYFDTNNKFSLEYVKLFLFARISLFLICVLKIVFYFGKDKVYSLISLLILSCSLIYYYFKFDGNILFVISQFSFLLSLCLIVISSYGISFDKLLKTYLISVGTLVVIRIIFSFMNILPNARNIPNGWGHYWNFGFGSHNAIFKYLVFLYAGWIYLTRDSKYRFIHGGLILASSLFIYKYTHCQTGMLVICMGIALLFAYNFLTKLSINRFSKPLLKVIKLGMSITPSFLVLGSIIGACLYNKYVFTHGSLNPKGKLYTFAQRFRQFSTDCALHGINLPWHTNESTQFAHQNFNWILGDSSMSDYSDNFVHSTLINYGIIWLLLFYLFFQAFAVYAAKNNEYHILIAISIIMIYSMMESPAYHLAWNPFLLLPFASNKFAHSNNTNIQSQVIKNSSRKNILTPTVIIPIILSIVAFIANYILFRLNYADVGAYIYISYSFIIIYTVTANILIDR